MNAHRFDQLAKTCGAVGSRRSVIGGLLGGALGLSRIGAAGANHRPGITARRVTSTPVIQGRRVSR